MTPMGIILAAALLSAAPPPRRGPMVRYTPLFEVKTWEAASRAKLEPAQSTWVAAYEALLRDTPFPTAKPETMAFARLEQRLLPVQLVRASGWSDGGHRELRPFVFLIDGAEPPRVISPRSRNLDEDGNRQRFTDFRACKPELFARTRALFDTLGGSFEAAHEALQQELCQPLPVRERLEAARKAGKVDAAFLKELVTLLALLAETSAGARVVASTAEVGDAKLTALLRGTKSNQARWVVGPVQVSAFVAAPATSLNATGTLVLEESTLTSWLKRFELEADGEVELTLQALAHSVTFIE